MCPQLVGSIGLMFDIIGAIFVAIEVVAVYRGSLTGSTWKTINKPNEEYVSHEKRKRKFMAVGLGFLLLGFLLQIVALWME